MANTPVMSLRVAPKHRPLVRKAARALRDQPRLAAQLAGLLNGKAPAEPGLGPFRDQEAALGFIRNRLAVCLRPEEIWLFGSRARGDARPDSDFDILVVLPDDAPLDHRMVHEPMIASGLACDVVPCHKAAFEGERGEPGTISAHVFNEGRLLYRRRAYRRER
jgi:uncharacterized protein